MRITVTGGSGFIGTALCRVLAAGQPFGAGLPFGIVDLRPSAAFPRAVRIADVRDLKGLQMAVEGEAIVHLAAAHDDDIRPAVLYDAVNAEGTRMVCRVAETRGIDRIIFTSSVAVYGPAPPGADESCPLAPVTPYGRSKAAAEVILRDWQAADAVRRSLTILRPTVVIGPGHRGNVRRLIAQIARGRFVLAGNGANIKSMCHVETVAARIAHLLAEPARPGVQVMNLVDGPDMTMLELVALIRGGLGLGQGPGPRLPRTVLLAGGAAADAVARLTGRTLPVSLDRVRKSAATTSFTTLHDPRAFPCPVPLREGLRQMLAAEMPLRPRRAGQREMTRA